MLVAITRLHHHDYSTLHTQDIMLVVITSLHNHNYITFHTQDIILVAITTTITIRPALHKLYWLSGKYRIKYTIILITYRALKLLAWFGAGLSNSKTIAVIRGLVVPRTRLKSYGDRAFSVKAPSLWNSLPLYMRTMSSMSTFLKMLKTNIFKMAFADVWFFMKGRFPSALNLKCVKV